MPRIQEDHEDMCSTSFSPSGTIGLFPSQCEIGKLFPARSYYEVMSIPAAHFAALCFLRLAIPSLRPWFVPPAPDAEPWINRELVGGISSRRARWKRQGLPSSRRNPCEHSPYSSDPGVTKQAEWTMSELPAAPATDNDEGSPRVVISGLDRTAFDLAVYASQGRYPPATQDSLPAAGPALLPPEVVFRMLLHTNPTRERGECLGTRRRVGRCGVREPVTRRITS